MTALIFFHTAVSLLPVAFGAYAFLRDGRIDPTNRVGKLYLATMFIGSVTAFGFIPSKGFFPGQVLTVMTLFFLFAGTFTLRGRLRAHGYVQAWSFSASYFMLMVFTTTETLKKFPLSDPFATTPADPSLLPIRMVLLVALVAGVAYEFVKIHASRRQESVQVGHQAA